ncbi:MAG: acetylornithine deacetylase [Gammaproteobacteria bacterium]|nr:acetylornithine deacetylase [Gammaproteobacteria bacterium]
MSKNSPKLINMVSQLIATPSISCVRPELDMSNEPVINLLANWLETSGFKVTKQRVNSGKYNLIATIGQGSDGLIFSGHTDTVPYDEALWQSDPFKLTEREGRYFGLGSCDMKSFIAMAIIASQKFDPEKFIHPLTIVATADEETTMSGARLLAENGKNLGQFCVIGEPTNLTPVREHKGIIMESIRFSGLSGHSSDPSLGNSALEAMHEFIQQLLVYRTQLQQKFKNTAFDVSTPTLNLGHIHGGDNPNRICGECELHIDLRFLPGMSIEELRDQVRSLAKKVASSREQRVSFTPLLMGIPAMQTASDSILNEYLQEVTQKQSQSVAFGTEAPFYNEMGCETIVMGPGSIKQAHQPDEFLPIDQIQPTVTLLENLIQRFCCK